MYPQFKFENFRPITVDEGNKLFDIVKELDANSILEIGTYGGFATLYLGKAINEYGKIVSVDYDKKLNPENAIRVNDLGTVNVQLEKVENYEELLKWINENKDVIKTFDVIFIDECHDRMKDFFPKLSKHIEDATVIFHDVECEEADLMQTPTVFKQLDNTKVISTKDDGGNLNSFGITKIEKVENVVEKPSAKEEIGEQISKATEELATEAKEDLKMEGELQQAPYTSKDTYPSLEKEESSNDEKTTQTTSKKRRKKSSKSEQE